MTTNINEYSFILLCKVEQYSLIVLNTKALVSWIIRGDSQGNEKA